MYTTLIEIEKKYNCSCRTPLALSHEKEIIKIFNGDISDIDLNNGFLLKFLGIYHQNITKNYEETEKVYLKSIDLGNSESLVNLGNYHKNVTKNYLEMERLYLKAIELGHVSAMFSFGNYHKHITKNYQEMERLYKMAIDLGNESAMFNLGLYYQEITKNYHEMERLYIMAIDLGNVSAMFNLGFYHQETSKNYPEMERLYIMAIDLGNALAMYNLGVYHQHITKNYPEMERLYKMAIDLGNHSAMLNLGCYYKDVTKNYLEMERLYMMAINLGDMSATVVLETFYPDPIYLFKILFKYFKDNICSEYFINLLKKVAKYDKVNKYIKSIFISPQNETLKYIYNKYIVNDINSNKGYKSDFKIIAISETQMNEYHVHSLILNSKYFHILHDGDFEIKNEITIYVNDFRTISILLKYLYLAEFDYNMDKDILNELYSISKEYLFEQLQEFCELSNLI